MGQEVQWQKGRLRTNSENKVGMPGGRGTGASIHNARATFGPTCPVLTTRPALGPSQGLLLREEKKPSDRSASLMGSGLTKGVEPFGAPRIITWLP